MKLKKFKTKAKGGMDLISEAVRVSKVLAKAGGSSAGGEVSEDVERRAEELMDSDAVRLGAFMASRFLKVR